VGAEGSGHPEARGKGGNLPPPLFFPPAASRCGPSCSWAFSVPRPLPVPVSEPLGLWWRGGGKGPLLGWWPRLAGPPLSGGNWEVLASKPPFLSTAVQARSSSYSGEYGSPGGEPFSHSGLQLEGPITAIRVRVDSFNIVGLQVRYGQVWSDYVGGKLGDLEIFLHPGESVIAVSGSYSNYLKTLNFVTDEGRFLSFGKDTGIMLYAVPLDPNTVLRFISGRAGLFVTAIGLHWDTIPETTPATAEPASSVAGPRGGV
uniref:Jacalin-type lectin domain-containing protein n=1 Tax=Oryctolagus cuniculus TaxID=9986 RepID=U3KMV4_RABIT